MPALRGGGIGSLDFGVADDDVLALLTSAYGGLRSDDSQTFTVNDGDLWTDEFGEGAFVTPIARTVCFVNTVCTYFGGTDAANLTFLGWEVNGEESPEPATIEGIMIGDLWSTHTASMTRNAGGCYNYGYGTTIEHRVMFNSYVRSRPVHRHHRPLRRGPRGVRALIRPPNVGVEMRPTSRSTGWRVVSGLRTSRPCAGGHVGSRAACGHLVESGRRGSSASRSSASSLSGAPVRQVRHSTPPWFMSNATSGPGSPQRTHSSSSGRTPSAASSFQKNAGTTSEPPRSPIVRSAPTTIRYSCGFGSRSSDIWSAASSTAIPDVRWSRSSTIGASDSTARPG
jgi:hypothetical protein